MPLLAYNLTRQHRNDEDDGNDGQPVGAVMVGDVSAGVHSAPCVVHACNAGSAGLQSHAVHPR